MKINQLKKSGLLLCILLVIISGLSACKAKTLQLGEEQTVEASKKNKPKWLINVPKPDRKNYYFVGSNISSVNTDRYAYQIALSKLSSFINTRTDNLFRQTEQSLNYLESNQLKEELIEQSSQASIKGAVQKELYWEKIEKLTEDGLRYFYRVYVLVLVPKAVVEESQKETLKLQVAKYKAKENQEVYLTLKNLQEELSKKDD